MNRFLFISCFFALNFFNSGKFFCSGSKPVDSLLKIIVSEKVDSNKIELLNDLSDEYWKSGIYDTALFYLDSAIHIAKRINNKSGLSQSYFILGSIYRSKGDYSKAIDAYFEVLKIVERNLDKSGVANAYGFIGETYSSIGKNAVALDYLFKSLEIAKQINNDGVVLKSLLKIGFVYFSSHQYDRAGEYFIQALEMAEKSNDVRSQALIYGDLGAVYGNLDQPKKALFYQFKSYELNRNMNLKMEMASNMVNIGSNFFKLKKYSEAQRYYTDALDIFISVGSLPYQKYTYTLLCELEEQKGNYKSAYNYFRLATVIKDSIFTIEKDKEITRKELNFEFQKKEDELKSKNDKQLAIAAERDSKLRTIIFSVVAGLCLVLAFSFFILRSLRLTQRQKKIIELQRNEVTEQKRIVESQKILVEAKQKEILDSINYASRIQDSLLGSKQLLDKFLVQYFIFYKPKDIVSGDFYWVEKSSSKLQLAVCDSTGHGVPGAFMSLLNITKLNEAFREKYIDLPGEIFDYVRQGIIDALNPEGTVNAGRDGMDAVLCSIDFNQQKLQYACANNSFYLIRDGQLIESELDKMPVGMHNNEITNFTTHSINLQKGDCIYLFTDGYADQFGGPKGKKFKYAQFKEMLIEVHQLPVENQKEIIENRFETWKGEMEQVDDILIIGFRV